MAIPLIGGLLGAVGDIAGTWVKGKMEEKRAHTEIKVAKAKAEATVYEKQATGELDMEKSLTEQMGGSWKDEAWTIARNGDEADWEHILFGWSHLEQVPMAAAAFRLLSWSDTDGLLRNLEIIKRARN